MKTVTSKSLILITLFYMMLGWSCNNGSQKSNNQHAGDSTSVSANIQFSDTVQRNISSNGVILTPFKDSPAFPDAKLRITSPRETEKLKAGKVKFQFEVSNYELKSQTTDAGAKLCANSRDGQHIHFIVNNEPYTALYEPQTESELKDGLNIVLAFLSRSYHESIKAPRAYQLNQYIVGNTMVKLADLTSPILFYSRPKGQYTGSDTKKIILDFYLVNTKLSSDGNKVRVTINSNEFLLTDWVPYYIEGLPMGDNTIKLELVDHNGNLITGMYNTVERKINLLP